MCYSVWEDFYGGDPIAAAQQRRGPVQRRSVTLAKHLVVEHTASQWCGAVVGWRGGFVDLEDRTGAVRSFSLQDSFLIDGKPTTLVLPQQKSRPVRTASGGIAADAPVRAKTARASRIFVEGRHDADLIGRVWSADLRDAGIAVEVLDGADNLAAVLTDFAPAENRRAGVLLDHLITNSKESRLAAAAVPDRIREFVLVTGHPYVDVWQAIKPHRLGMAAWPVIPKQLEWKTGVLQHLGLPHTTQADVSQAWQQMLRRVRTYQDLESPFVGAVERLIDFVADA